MDKKYVMSYDGETFEENVCLDGANTKEEACTIVRNIMQDEEMESIWIGVRRDLKARDVISSDLADRITDGLYDQAYDLTDGRSDDYNYLLSIPKEAIDELEETLEDIAEKWLVKNKLEPDFWIAEEVEEVRRQES